MLEEIYWVTSKNKHIGIRKIGRLGDGLQAVLMKIYSNICMRFGVFGVELKWWVHFYRSHNPRLEIDDKKKGIIVLIWKNEFFELNIEFNIEFSENLKEWVKEYHII